MRHPERELKNEETIKALLEKSPVGRIATVNGRGIPVIKPVNFLYGEGRIYVHSSQRGEKIEDIRRGSAVCFEVDEPIAFVTTRGSACKVNYYYRSVIIKGRALLVEDPVRKQEILHRLMEKYQPEEGHRGMPGEGVGKTAVVEISIIELTAKENMG